MYFPSQKPLSFARQALALIVFVALSRVIPHPPNFTPLFSVTIFSAYFAPSFWWAIAIPQGALLLSNIFIGFSSSAMITAIFCVGMAVFAKSAKCVTNSQSIFWLASSIVVPALFFVVSNFFVWLDSSFYSQDLAGLVLCYTSAVPFALSSFTSTLAYSFLFFEVPRMLSILYNGVIGHEMEQN